MYPIPISAAEEEEEEERERAEGEAEQWALDLLDKPPAEAERLLSGLRRSAPQLWARTIDTLTGWRAEAAAACQGNYPGANARLRNLTARLLGEDAVGGISPEEERQDAGRLAGERCRRLAAALSPGRIWDVLPYTTVESFPVLRWDWLTAARDRLESVKPPACDLSAVLDFDESTVLGQGASGVVYRGTFRDDPAAYPVAVKLSKELQRGARVAAERKASLLVNSLVVQGSSPNFTLLYQECSIPASQAPRRWWWPFPTGEPETVNPVTVTELADGDLWRLMNGGNAPHEALLMSLVVQTLMAIAAMSHLDLSHNDLILDNVLYNHIEPSIWFEYRALGGTYTVPTFGYLAKIVDFEYATSSLIGRPHSEHSEFIAAAAGRDVSEVRIFRLDVGNFLQDMVRSLVQTKGEPTNGVEEWLYWAAEAVERLSGGRYDAHSPRALQQFLRTILDDPRAERVLRSLEFVPPEGTRVLRFDIDSIPYLGQAGRP